MSVYQLAQVITAHAWNGDKSMVAVCENDSLVVIYSNCSNADVKKWNKEHILKAHSMVVCGIDWHPTTNKIVTCSHDINAFVWTLDIRNNEWKPSLSILRINRAALQVRWSPDGSKFAIASGSKVVPVCYYESKNDWWISKMIKKHKSTVIDVAWHPNSQLVATASSDFKCRVFSAFIATEEAPATTVFGSMEKFPFGELITEFDSASGWVEAVAWSPTGEFLAFAGHDSSISFVSFPRGQPYCQTLKTKSLPYATLCFLSDSILIAAGHSFRPEVFQNEKNVWALLGDADSNKGAAPTKAKKKNAFAGAKGIWESKIAIGQNANKGAELTSKHHNVITQICPYGNARMTEFDAFSTSGLDGRIILWNRQTLESNVPGIRL